MFSYLKAMSSVTDETIYHRGIKSYLDGHVGRWRAEELEHWRTFQVIGSTEYEVQIPLLHSLLPGTKPVKAGNILKRFARCSCPYYDQYEGFCKHIVAVCAHLDNEFKPIQQVDELQNTSIIDNVFEYSVEKNKRVWHQTFDQCIKKGPRVVRGSDVTALIVECAREPKIYADLIDSFHPLVDRRMGRYAYEKIIAEYISFCVGFDTKNTFWIDFWRPYIEHLDIAIQAQLIADSWYILNQKKLHSSRNNLLEFVRSRPSSIKEHALQLIKKSGSSNWIEFSVIAKMTEWLADHIKEFDPEKILDISEIIPDQHELLERELMSHIKAWSDYLQTKQVKDLISILDRWKTQFGRSSYYEQTIEYLLTSHPKKRSLVNGLK